MYLEVIQEHMIDLSQASNDDSGYRLYLKQHCILKVVVHCCTQKLDGKYSIEKIDFDSKILVLCISY
jgi:hypothetical protein